MGLGQKITHTEPRVWRCVLQSKVHPWLDGRSYHRDLMREYVKHCPIVATVDFKDKYKTPEWIRKCCPEVNMTGVLAAKEFTNLIRTSAVYIGVGEPLIASSVFEALSQGTHVVQPRHPEPQVLKNKPITQGWTSQHPFLEQVPEPYAFTINPRDPENVARAFREIRRVFDEAQAANQVKVTQGPLADFYNSGLYPKREVYAVDGFLTRVADIVQRTKPLTVDDYEWEKTVHLNQLPQWVQGAAR